MENKALLEILQALQLYYEMEEQNEHINFNS